MSNFVSCLYLVIFNKYITTIDSAVNTGSNRTQNVFGAQVLNYIELNKCGWLSEFSVAHSLSPFSVDSVEYIFQ